MASVYALVKCIHESHSEHPSIITLHFFIKSWNLLQSNIKIAKLSKVIAIQQKRGKKNIHASVTNYRYRLS
ncbi:hypothetical protein FYK26_24635 (plasmid) [Escherichia albertii]|nr:hypothetical protein FYK29_24620 [Escherichia albertii]QSZ96277.1 hypothetical protein FYK28_24655 [Escherichia albertii]QTA00710.1 hypothetical protein FYK27_25010 [Escherichia albertii]QTA05065.1 hypothetical protein FYK26_24635 [Escherichia albertii]QTA14394.1 hypothetical protein FYK20_26510 [Escherichia albertii]